MKVGANIIQGEGNKSEGGVDKQEGGRRTRVYRIKRETTGMSLNKISLVRDGRKSEGREIDS